ncbi:hypothetical protein ACFL5M_06385 [Candidatus Neomarinimicrobiota bacterium]
MLPDTLNTVVQSQTDKWSGIAALAALCSAVVALAMLILLTINQMQERKRHRPYISIQGAGINKTSDDEISIYVTFMNTGDVPAKGLDGRILFIDPEGNRNREYEYALSTVNDIPTDIPIPWELSPIKVLGETMPYYIYIELHYQNALTRKSYSHRTYMKGLGVKADQIKSSFDLATSAEADSIDKYLGKP